MNAARIMDMARRRAGVSQRELARRAGIPQPTISRIERGVISPTVATLERLVRACGMELEVVDRPGEDSVDRTLIRERLKMTASERARAAVRDWRRLQARRQRARRFVRDYQQADRSALNALMDSFGEELAAMDRWRRLVRGDGYGETLVSAMLEEADRVVVADVRGGVVGFGAVTIHERSGRELLDIPPGRTGRVIELYVEPAYRRRSLGWAILYTLEQHLREKGCDVARIAVFAPNVDARRFYERLGYEERDVDLFKPL